MNFSDQFEKFIKKHELLHEGDKVLLAVSGGMDSVVLLDLFLHITHSWNLELSVAHLNHGLRDKMADRDEAFVRNLAGSKGLHFYSRKVDVNQYCKVHKLSLEEGARNLRFEFLNSLMDRLKYDRLALGHQKNDQAETILMNLIRGSGLRGLGGIRPGRGRMIRPLLFATREQIQSYAEDRGLDNVDDVSNRDRRFLRNRVRLDVFPELEKATGHHAVTGFYRTGNACEEAEDYLKYSAREALKEIIVSRSKDEIILDIYKFLSYFKVVQKYVLFQIFEEEFPQEGISHFKIDRLLRLAEEGRSGGFLELANGGRVMRSRNRLVFLRKHLSIPEMPVPVGRQLNLSDIGLQFRSELLERKENKIVFTSERGIEYLDYDTISFPMHLRSFRQGDKFIPLGMAQKKKLHDFFIDEKIPVYRRTSIPLLVGEEEIIWVVGYRINDRFKVTGKTKKILKVEVNRIQS